MLSITPFTWVCKNYHISIFYGLTWFLLRSPAIWVVTHTDTLKMAALPMLGVQDCFQDEKPQRMCLHFLRHFIQPSPLGTGRILGLLNQRVSPHPSPNPKNLILLVPQENLLFTEQLPPKHLPLLFPILLLFFSLFLYLPIVPIVGRLTNPMLVNFYGVASPDQRTLSRRGDFTLGPFKADKKGRGKRKLYLSIWN